MIQVLTHSFPIHPTPCKHQKTLWFSVFRGQRYDALGTDGLILYLALKGLNFEKLLYRRKQGTY